MRGYVWTKLDVMKLWRVKQTVVIDLPTRRVVAAHRYLEVPPRTASVRQEDYGGRDPAGLPDAETSQKRHGGTLEPQGSLSGCKEPGNVAYLHEAP